MPKINWCLDLGPNHIWYEYQVRDPLGLDVLQILWPAIKGLIRPEKKLFGSGNGAEKFRVGR